MIQAQGDQTKIAPPEVSISQPQETGGADIKVLLVGNMEPEISGIQNFLQQNIVPSYRAYHCVDALEASSFLKHKTVDIILLDFGFTEKDDAADIFTVIRHSASKTPIIIFTGEVEHDLALLIMNEGATDNLTWEKYTASPKSLKDAIEAALIKKKMLSKNDAAMPPNIGAKSATDLLRAEEKYMSELEHIQKKHTEELKQVQEKSVTELRKIQEKSAAELKELYAKKIADIEYHQKILSWINGSSIAKSTETGPTAKTEGAG